MITITLLFNICLSAQNNSKLNNFVKQNFKKSSSTKTHYIGKFPKCNYLEVYFVQGFNRNKKLVERQMVYLQNGKYIVSNKFIIWGGEYSLVMYDFKGNKKETAFDLKNLNISYKNEKFTFSNLIIRALNAKKLKTPSEENESELSGSYEFTFKSYLEEIENCE